MEATGIRSREAVRWFSPHTLASMLTAVAVGKIRRRRAPAGGPAAPGLVIDTLPPDSAGDRWFDFVADSGDGFDATVTVASLLAAPSLQLGEHHTRRGSLLVHGGDMVYPAGSEVGYRERFVSPLAAMLPAADPSPMIAGIPGNHDLYDGLHAWSDLMTTGSSIGGWTSAQSESFFAARLSDRWWLWAVDIDRDEFAGRQLEYFTGVGADMPAGAQVILVAPNPTWVDERTPIRQEAIVDVLTDIGAELRLILTGDVHNHHRYTTDDGVSLTHITSGGGGAFLSPSHSLPAAMSVAGRSLSLVSESVYPDPATSRALIRRAPSLLWRNGQLPLLLAALYALVGAIVGDASSFGARGAVAALATLAATLVFTRRRSATAILAAVVHAALHLAIMAAIAALLEPSVERFFALALAGGTLGALAMGLAMMFAATIGINENELFSAIRVDDYRGFLRVRIDAREGVTVFPIGINDTRRMWHHVDDPEPGAPRLAPAKPVQPHLIEPPVRLEPARLPTA